MCFLFVVGWCVFFDEKNEVVVVVNVKFVFVFGFCSVMWMSVGSIVGVVESSVSFVIVLRGKFEVVGDGGFYFVYCLSFVFVKFDEGIIFVMYDKDVFFFVGFGDGDEFIYCVWVRLSYVIVVSI